MKKLICFALVIIMLVLPVCSISAAAAAEDDEIVLRICSWEDYIDLGGWDEDELIELENGVNILGENSEVEDFEQWYYDTYHKKVRVEYSTFGTNEELYNQLTLGTEFDLVCPSEYMIMKLISEDMLTPYSESFFDESVEENYYIRGVSDFIRDMFDTHEINGHKWSEYAAGYLWGSTGIVYNPELVSEEDVQSWDILMNEKYFRQTTIKDNVRDSYFAAVGILKHDLLTSDEFINSPDYAARLQEEMNDTSDETIAGVEKILKQCRDNVYAFETDSGKGDMVTGKIVAIYQWSGDAVYTMEQAEEDGKYFNYSIPEECSNIWFDGWVMLKNGINGDAEKQHAAEAFANFVARPDNVVRNMYFIGYSSVISGGEDDTVFDYVKWYYEAEEDEEETVEYDLSYFFGEGRVLTVPEEQTRRELFAQYPSDEVRKRMSIMEYFDKDTNQKINQMWINVRCNELSGTGLIIAYVVMGILLVAAIAMVVIVRVKNKIRTASRKTQKTKY